MPCTKPCPLSSLPVFYDIYRQLLYIYALIFKLRACKFGIVNITQPYKEFPAELKEIKDRFSIKLKWNTLLAAIIQDTLCLAQQNNNIVLALSNIHIVDKAKDFREKVKKRLAKTSINRRIVRRVFGDNYKKKLQIPCFINNYN